MTIVKLSELKTISEWSTSGRIEAPNKPLRSFNARLLHQVSLWKGDITTLEVDAIVNAANGSLLGGGGVDGAIHRAAGPLLYKECEALNGARTGEAKITKGYRLPATHIIHAVGPVYKSQKREQCAEQLSSAYRTSLQIAKQHSLKSIAFPCISTGIYGYPIVDATHVVLSELRDFLDTHDSQFERVVLVMFSNDDLSVYQSLLPLYFPPSTANSAEE